MGLDVAARPQPEERVQNTPVADVDPGCLHLTLPDVLVPALQLPDHGGLGEDVQVSLDGRVGDAERPRELRCVPRLAVVVREHRPEPAHRRGQQTKPKSGDLAFEIRSDQLAPPSDARLLRTGERFGYHPPGSADWEDS